MSSPARTAGAGHGGDQQTWAPAAARERLVHKQCELGRASLSRDGADQISIAPDRIGSGSCWSTSSRVAGRVWPSSKQLHLLRAGVLHILIYSEAPADPHGHQDAHEDTSKRVRADGTSEASRRHDIEDAPASTIAGVALL